MPLHRKSYFLPSPPQHTSPFYVRVQYAQRLSRASRANLARGTMVSRVVSRAARAAMVAAWIKRVACHMPVRRCADADRPGERPSRPPAECPPRRLPASPAPHRVLWLPRLAALASPLPRRSCCCEFQASSRHQKRSRRGSLGWERRDFFVNQGVRVKDEKGGGEKGGGES